VSASPSTPPSVTVPISLRWRDMDMLGHLNQAVYHEMLEEGRAGLFRALHEQGHGFAFVLVRVELDYKHEIRHDHGTVDVVVTVASVGRSSVTISHDVVLSDGTVAATGSSVLVAWDMSERTSRELTDGERRVLAG
jgi:acyl-CoA thioester hydrolase